MNDMDSLFSYRFQQAEDTLSEAEKMLTDDAYSARTIINRAYYSMYYAVQALFIRTGHQLKTSKHSGVIAIFDHEFVKTGLFDKGLSKIFHKAFDDRQEFDYKEFVVAAREDAVETVKGAQEFIAEIKKFLENNENVTNHTPGNR